MGTGSLVIRNIRALRWTGSNGALIAQMCGEIEVDEATWSVQTETPERLVLFQRQAGGANPGYWTITPAKPWVLISNDFPGVFANLSDQAFVNRYATWNELLQTAVSEAVISIPTYVLINTSGELPLPALSAVAPNFTAVVPLRNAMPNATYNVTWRATAGAAVLSAIGLQAGKTVTKTASAVTIPLRTSGVATISGIVTVEASLLMAI